MRVTRAKQPLLEATTYCLVIVSLDLLAVYLLTGNTALALEFIVVSNLYTPISYFLHERIWAHGAWGKHPTRSQS